MKIPDIIYESHFRNSCSQEIKKKYFEEDLFIFRMIKTLTEKDCFGESALSTNKPRFATILAIKDLKVLTLLKEDFERGFSKINQESQTKLDFFKKLFERNQNEFSSNLLMRFIYYFHEQELAPNKIIFNQWDIPNDFFVIISGEIEISQHIINQQIVESKPLFSVNEALKKSRMMFNIAKLGSFNLLGEDDIIEEKKKRSYTATTTSHVKLYVISKQVK